jgi:hypothetical protein
MFMRQSITEQTTDFQQGLELLIYPDFVIIA